MRFIRWCWPLALLVGVPSYAGASGEKVHKEQASSQSAPLHWSFDPGAVLQTEAGTRLLGIHLGISPGLVVSSIKEPEARRTTVDTQLSRLRLQISGSPIPLNLGYAMSLALDQGVLSLKDVWVDAALGNPAIWLRAGQVRRAFSRQGLTPYYRMVFPDRPLTEKVFESGHDAGAMFHSGPWGTFEWALAFLMGDYDSPSHAGARLRREEIPSKEVTSVGSGSLLLRLARRSKQGGMYNESDVHKRPFRWSVGMSLQAFLTEEEEARAALQAEVDLHIAARGWTLIGAFFVATEQEASNLEDQAFQGAGYTLQTSMLLGDSFEPSVRFTHLIFPGASTDVKDVSVGLSWMFHGGMLRWLNRVGMTLRDIEGGYRSDVALKSFLQFRY